MKNKKLMSLVMAGALSASLAVPAFAANNTTVEITGTYADTPIEVDVPTTGTAQINPYGLDVKIGTSTSKITGQQIVTQPLAVVNRTTMDLDVNASVIGLATGNFKFAAAPIKGADPAVTTNSAFVYLEMTAGTGSIIKTDGSLDQDVLNTQFAGWAASTYTANDATKLVVSTKANDSTQALLTLAKGTEASGKVTPAAAGVGLFRLTGDCVKSPKIAWADTDGFTATIAFTFGPHEAAPSISLDVTELALEAGGSSASGTVTATFDADGSGLSVTTWAWTADPANVVTLTNDNTATVTAAHANDGTTTLTVTATLSDGSSLTATCDVTCST